MSKDIKMRIDLGGLVSNIKRQFKRDGNYNLGCFNIDQLEGHIRLMTTQYQAGDHSAIDEFIDLYNLKIEPIKVIDSDNPISESKPKAKICKDCGIGFIPEYEEDERCASCDTNFNVGRPH